MIRLIKGDCLEVLKQLIKEGIKVDAIITDPPYGTTNCKWDSIIPFDKMWNLLKQIRKDNSPIVLFGAEPFSSHLRVSNIEEFKYDIIWDKVKGTNFYNVNKQVLRNHEVISVFYKEQCTYNPQKTYGHSLKKSVKKKESNSDVYNNNTKDCSYESTERFPRSIQVFSTDTQKSAVHDTQKPLKLMEWLVNTFTNEGDLVLDFTMGSGTTGIACKTRNRDFIGIELLDKWYDSAVIRLETEGNQLSLF